MTPPDREGAAPDVSRRPLAAPHISSAAWWVIYAGLVLAFVVWMQAT